MGSRGDSYGSALAESVIGPFKTEVIRRLAHRVDRLLMDPLKLKTFDGAPKRRAAAGGAGRPALSHRTASGGRLPGRRWPGRNG